MSDVIDELRNDVHFRGLAEKEFEDDPDFWRRQAKFSSGIMQGFAVAICAIGGDEPI